MPVPRVLDISHYKVAPHSLNLVANVGIWGIINKCTLGIDYVDPSYEQNRQEILNAGLLHGAYHFNDGSDPIAQCDFFIAHAKPAPDTLMALDFEHYKSPMTMENVVRFLRHFESIMGYKAVIYSGNRIKEHIHELCYTDYQYLRQHRLWLAQYNNHKIWLPEGFKSYFLHQYTSDGTCSRSYTPVDALVSGGLDLNEYLDSREILQANWGNCHHTDQLPVAQTSTLVTMHQSEQSTLLPTPIGLPPDPPEQLAIIKSFFI